MGDIYPEIKVAAVQAAPVFLDKEASTAKACSLIRQAGKNGAKIVAFPEGFIPAHPVWFHFHPGRGEVATKLSIDLFKNSVEIPGPEVEQLCEAAREAKAYVVIGICEKLPNTTGNMFNSQIFIGPDGTYLGKHQKITPTGGERIVHAQGYGDTFGVFQSEYGPLSSLICGENSNPLATFALTAEGTRIHVMSWPNHISKKAPPLQQRVMNDSKAFAQVSKAFVISACSVIDERMIEMLEVNEGDEEFLRNKKVTGGSVIVAPNTKVIAGPLGSEEEILYGGISLEECIKMKLRHDFAGHYNRPDIFQLYVNKAAPKIYQVNTIISGLQEPKDCMEESLEMERDSKHD